MPIRNDSVEAQAAQARVRNKRPLTERLYMPLAVISLGPEKNPICAVRLYHHGERVCFCGCDTPVGHRAWVRGHYKRGPYWTSEDELAETRFLQKVVIDPDTGCWLWTAMINNGGYGGFQVGARKKHIAHRWAYERFVGPVPEGLELDHLCRVRHCVNPDHLEPVTRKENSRRGISPMALNLRKTHCPKGHPYDDENTWRDKNGGRHCKACKREWVRRWKERKRQEGAIAA